MNYGELKHNLISLGFAEEADLEEYEDLGYLYDAVNRAIDDITVFFPYVAKYEIDIDEDDTDMLYIDMTEQKGFLRLGETPVLFERNGTEYFKKFTDYDTENNETTLVINPSGNEGSYRIYYEKQCTPINSNTPDTFELEFPLVAHSLVPLLAAYYLWLDDEEQKATMYNNLYEQKLAQLLAKKKTKATVTPDSEWGLI